jgi:hypothetical protein
LQSHCKSYISLCWSNRLWKVPAKAEPIKGYTGFVFLRSSISAAEKKIYKSARPINKNLVTAITLVSSDVKEVAAM